ncbi:hypothetical protein BKA56DRAFT_605260, partial [Ilyonectria sp. MPI-CAGE-AT-0026]
MKVLIGPKVFDHVFTGGFDRAASRRLTGWTWLIANWTITLSVNFSFASLLKGTITMLDL